MTPPTDQKQSLTRSVDPQGKYRCERITRVTVNNIVDFPTPLTRVIV